MTDHTVRSFDQELDSLKEMLKAMGKLTCQQLKAAVDAIATSDRAIAKRIIDREAEANRMEHEIDQLAIRLLALRHPVAIDLRQVLAAQRIANELERISDYAEDLAERLIGIHEVGGEPIAPLVSLGHFAVALVEDAMAAYARSDAEQAKEVRARDKDLDEMYSTFFGKALAFMTGDARRTSTGTQMLMMARALERAGDRATNIAEMVRYLTEGTIIDEKRPKANATKAL
jgi:phosphate transport system protein